VLSVFVYCWEGILAWIDEAAFFIHCCSWRLHGDTVVPFCSDSFEREGKRRRGRVRTCVSRLYVSDCLLVTLSVGQAGLLDFGETKEDGLLSGKKWENQVKELGLWCIHRHALRIEEETPEKRD